MKLQPDSFTVIPELAPLGSKRRPGAKIQKMVFLVAHDTGNPGASARAHARWYQNDPNPPPGQVSSAHLFVDDREVIETVPSGLVAGSAAEIAYHVLYSVPTDNQMFGADANSAAIGVELCYGGTIRPEDTYRRYVWTLAKLCVAHGLDPSWRIVGHEVLDPKRKRDPSQGLTAIGKSYDGLIADVVRTVKDFGAAFAATDAPQPATMRAARVHLNVRDAASSAASRLFQLTPGEEVDVLALQTGERVYGIAEWCQVKHAQRGIGWCWAGGLA
ncbi:MAG: N-acetylmuramoyl-L-alanine amidase [Roseococcus sp.]|nr:N-acetylmuramoyl-L-alanine amidase [Roseococcus sp.]